MMRITAYAARRRRLAAQERQLGKGVSAEQSAADGRPKTSKSLHLRPQKH